MPLDERSSLLRDKVLGKSGGWLGELTIILADLLGIWDILVLAVVFVVAWVVIRIMPKGSSVAIAMLFDVAIPLQYQWNDKFKKKHQQHLEDYWKLQAIGFTAEGAGFVFLLPDVFTLCVAFKTTGCLYMWLWKKKDGRPVDLLSGETLNDLSRSSRNLAPSDNDDTSRSSRKSSSRTEKIVDERFPNADRDLKAAGYKSATVREGMIRHLIGGAEKDAAANLHTWLTSANNTKRFEKRTKEYRERAKRDREKEKKRKSSPPTRRMLLRGDERTQVKSELKKKRKTPQGEPISPEMRQEILDLIEKSQTRQDLAQILAAVGIVAPSVKSHALDDVVSNKKLRTWGKVLHTLGVDKLTMDAIIDDMLNQTDERTANMRFKVWEDLSKQKPSAARTARFHELMSPYADRLDEALYNGAIRLRPVWEPDGM